MHFQWSSKYYRKSIKFFYGNSIPWNFRWYFDDHRKCIELHQICIEIFRWHPNMHRICIKIFRWEFNWTIFFFFFVFSLRSSISRPLIPPKEKWLYRAESKMMRRVARWRHPNIQHHTFYLHYALVFPVSSKTLSSITRYLLCMVGSMCKNSYFWGVK